MKKEKQIALGKALKNLIEKNPAIAAGGLDLEDEEQLFALARGLWASYKEEREAQKRSRREAEGKNSGKTKTVWSRIGYSLEVGEKEYEKIKREALDKEASESYGYDVFEDLEIGGKLLKKFIREGKPDGDSYIPGDVWES